MALHYLKDLDEDARARRRTTLNYHGYISFLVPIAGIIITSIVRHIRKPKQEPRLLTSWIWLHLYAPLSAQWPQLGPLGLWLSVAGYSAWQAFLVFRRTDEGFVAQLSLELLAMILWIGMENYDANSTKIDRLPPPNEALRDYSSVEPPAPFLASDKELASELPPAGCFV